MSLQEWLDHERISAIQAAKRWSVWIGRGNDGTSERAAISNWYAWARREREPGLFHGMLLVVFTAGLVGLWELLDRHPLPGAPALVPLFGPSPAEAARQRAGEDAKRKDGPANSA